MSLVLTVKILAVDSSGQVASAAVLTENELVAEYSVDYKKTHSQTLLPMIDELLKMTETKGEELTAIAVAKGPGSFTGLRIGASTVKGLGMVWNVPIIPVSTLLGLAGRLAGTEELICPLMDARRQQVYTGIYDLSGSTDVEYMADCCVELDSVLAKINELGRKTVFLGDGVAVCRDRIAELVTVPYRFAPIHQRKQSAAAVGYMALSLWNEGKTVSAMEFTPEYLRASQAEREREERLGH